MRIISGKYGRRRFDVPKGLKLRPTTDISKEALFGMLQTLIDFEGIEVLDLFTGTGNIGLECVSRDAAKVVMVDKQPKHIAFVRSVIELLGANKETDTRVKDVRSLLREAKTNPGSEQFDLIFADPPYDLPWLEEIPQMIFEAQLLRSGGVFVLEHPAIYDFSIHPYFIKHRNYSAVNFSLFALK